MLFKKIIKGLLSDWCKLKKRVRGEGGIEPLAFYGPTDLKSALRPIEDHHRSYQMEVHKKDNTETI